MQMGELHTILLSLELKDFRIDLLWKLHNNIVNSVPR